VDLDADPGKPKWPLIEDKIKSFDILKSFFKFVEYLCEYISKERQVRNRVLYF
jgi:hypothetical protein